MKPIKLKMCAFGPYAKEEVIDFTLLENQSLFLITGPTGAGKTTVFDAICYALYGKTNGNDRPESSVRSDQALPEDMTQVEFTFEIKGKVYEVHRMPKQLKPKLRGEGFTEQAAEATFSSETLKRPVSGVKQVTEAVEQTIGLKIDQFRQIMMIPQGEFRALLMSSSDERAEILKNLFKTYLYDRIQQKANEAQKKLYNVIREYDIRKKTLVQSVSEDLVDIDDSESTDYILMRLQEKLDKLTDEIHLSKEALDKTQAILQEKTLQKDRFESHNKRHLDYLAAMEEIQGLNQKEHLMNDLKAKLELLDQVKGLQHFSLDMAVEEANIQEVKSKLKSSQDEIAVRQKAYERANDAWTAIKSPEHTLQIQILNKSLEGTINQLGLLKEYHHALESYKSIRDKFDQVHKAIEEISKDESLQNTAILDLKNHIESLSKAPVALVKAQGEFDKVKQRHKHLLGLESQVHHLMEAYKAYNHLKDQWDHEHQAREKALKTYQEIKLNYHRNQAIVLAASLEEGESCPVCGSLDHPAPAHQNEAIKWVSEEDLNRGEATYNQMESNFQKYLSSLDHKYQTLEGEVRKIGTLIMAEMPIEALELEDTLELVDTLDAVEGDSSKYPLEATDHKVTIDFYEDQIKTQLIENDLKIKKLRKDIDDLTQKQVQFEADQGRLKIKEAELNDLNRLKINLEKEFNDLKTHVQVQKVNCERLEKLIENTQLEPEVLEETIQSIKEKLSQNDQLVISLEKTFEEARSQLTEAEKKLEVLSHQLEEATQRHEKLSQKFKAGLDQSKLEETQFRNLLNELNQFESLKNEIQTFDIRRLKCQTKIETLKREMAHEPLKDLEVLNVELSKYKEVQKKDQGQLELLRNQFYQLNKTHVEIQKIQREMGEKERLYKGIGHLSKVLNGNNSKNLSFERYILSAYLSNILTVANLRLRDMTNGRYRLQIASEVSDHRKGAGLDLEVFDAYTGVPRSVKTLSGGESFKTSLALALSLSEVVQQTAGGIGLDTVFIDEGFGTLDQESLESAIESLVSLKDAGRLVGIISHVEALKERVKVKLEVLPTDVGSTTRFVFD